MQPNGIHLAQVYVAWRVLHIVLHDKALAQQISTHEVQIPKLNYAPITQPFDPVGVVQSLS